MAFTPPPLRFSNGELTQFLRKIQPSDYSPVYTVASTATNPKKSLTPESRQPVKEVFYSPDFDTNIFEISFQSYSVRIPTEKSGQFISECKKQKHLLSLPKARTVVEDLDLVTLPPAYITLTPELKQYKRILLSTTYFPSKVSKEPYAKDEHTQDYLVSQLPESMSALLSKFNAEIVPQSLVFKYDYFSLDDVLRSLLPDGMVIPSSFAQTGHIAHLNLRDEQLPFKYVIGRVVVDKHPSVRTTINKVGTIDNVFRNFQAEILFGDPDLETIVKEHGTTFSFNFSEVYWNSRLLTEHARLVDFVTALQKRQYQQASANPQSQNQDRTPQLQGKHQLYEEILQSNQFVLDPFGGIGPFTLPLAQRGCLVWGSDINPRSSLYMYRNSALNKVSIHQYSDSLKSMVASANLSANQLNTVILLLSTFIQQLSEDTGRDQPTEAERPPQSDAAVDSDAAIQTLQTSKKRIDDLIQMISHNVQQVDSIQRSISSFTPQIAQPGTRAAPRGAVSVFNACARSLNTTIAQRQMIQEIAKHHSDIPVDGSPGHPVATSMVDCNQAHTLDRSDYHLSQPNALPATILGVSNGSTRLDTDASTTSTADAAVQEWVADVTEKIKHFYHLLTHDYPSIFQHYERATDILFAKYTPPFHHVIMNLPGSAVEFLDMFVGLYTHNNLSMDHLTTQSNEIDDHDALASPKPSKGVALPPVLDDAYAELIKSTRVDDPRHDWSTLRDMYQPVSSTNDQSRDSILAQIQPSQLASAIPHISTLMRDYLVKNPLIVHCHCFVRSPDDMFGEALNLVEGHLGFQLASTPPSSADSFMHDSNGDSYHSFKGSYVSQTLHLDHSHKFVQLTETENYSNLHVLDVLANQMRVQNEVIHPRLDQHRGSCATLQTPSKGETDEQKSHTQDETTMLMIECIERYGYYVHNIRNVAPLKEMMCVSFKVPLYALTWGGDDEANNSLGEQYRNKLTLTRYALHLMKKQAETSPEMNTEQVTTLEKKPRYN